MLPKVAHSVSANLYGLCVVSVTVFHSQTPILGLIVSFVVQLDMKCNYLYLQPMAQMYNYYTGSTRP